MKKLLLVVLLAGLGSGCSSMDSKMSSSDSMMKQDKMMDSTGGGSMMKEGEAMDSMEGDTMMKEDGMMDN